MLKRVRLHKIQIYSVLIGLFFILILHFKISYSLIPILLAVSGIFLIVSQSKKSSWRLTKEEVILIAVFLFYFFLFVLSIIVHQGKFSELDLPSRVLLALPILALCCRTPLKSLWIIYAVLSACLIAGIVGMVQVFVLGEEKAFPKMMHIQAGDIAMSLAMFSFVALFYFHAKKRTKSVILSLIAGLFGIIAGFLTTARGGWIGAPFVLAVIFFLNREHFSKRLALGILVILTAGSFLAQDIIRQRYSDAQEDISAYADRTNTSTSVGARFDMWKSAYLGIREKPIFGWGLQGIREMREQHYNRGEISEFAAGFTHAHNQYLHDASARGILGLIALLAVLLAPFSLFWRNLRAEAFDSPSRLWSMLGIVHILMTMSYFLTQSFLAHNSGMMFYFVTTVIFLGLQKTTKKRPLVEN